MLDLKLARKLRQAAGRGDIAGIREALAEGADINGVRGQSYPPLHEAVRKNQLLAVEYLVSCGADVNLVANFGSHAFTPLVLATHLHTDDCLVLLLENGANPYLKFESGHWIRTSFVHANDAQKAILRRYSHIWRSTHIHE